MKLNEITFDKITHLVFSPHEVVDVFTDYDIDLIGVIHVGAHYGQEYGDYVMMGLEHMMFFEPVPSTFKKLIESLPLYQSIKCYNLALGNKSGVVDMYIETENKGQSSSILEPGTHLDMYPQIVFPTKIKVAIDKLDNIAFDREQYNILNVDVQGYELEVFKGAQETLNFIDVIFTEINTKEVYKGCAKLNELDDYLIPLGFSRVHTHEFVGTGYGDAIYIKDHDKTI